MKKQRRCRRAAGTEDYMIERFRMNFAPGMDERVISVCLPKGYHENAAAYPVMYMFDGQNAFEEEIANYGNSWRLHEFTENWEKDIIIVGVESSQESDRHLAEYCPYHLAPRMWEGLRGRGRSTMEWIIGTLKQKIDSRYRTLGDRLCTGVMGAGLGGLMSLYAVTAFNDVFSKAVCLSVPTGVCYPQLLRQVRESRIDPDTRVYLAIGENEARDKKMLAHMVCSNLTIANTLMDKHARVYPFLQQGGRHCEEDWRAQTEAFMHFLWLE